MKTILIILLSSCISVFAGIPDKAKYDLHLPGLHKSVSGQSVGPDEYHQIRNSKSEVTLVSGAYFTIGTHSGLSESILDDNCQITYGHPLAKTSYPIFAIDGTWYNADDYFTDAASLLPVKNQDTLKISTIEEGLFSFQLKIHQDSIQNEIHLLLQIQNIDSIAHMFGAGIQIDPALGKWGDGHLQWNDSFFRNDTLVENLTGQSALTIWERAAGAKGLGIEIKTGDGFNGQFIAANWADIYDQPGPQFEYSQLRSLYDLVLRIHGQETELEPGAKLELKSTIRLMEPDFGSSAFLRWDLPSAFSMENNRLFPRSFPTYTEITNNSASDLSDVTIDLDLPSVFSATYSSNSLDLPAATPTSQRVDLNSKLVYEDMIIPLTVRLNHGGDPLDELTRMVLLPATPMSDSGLVVIEDSISTSAYPDIDLIFGIEIAETGNWITDLSTENIFLYENGSKITNYNLDKFHIDGSNLADVCFVLDCSGSMGDDIEDVKNNLNEFADSLKAKGFDYQIGVVTFSTDVDDVWDFTNDIEQVKQNLDGINLWGGWEDSPAALYRASELSWRPQSRRTIIWITDEPYPEHSYTKEEIVNRMLSMGIVVHGVGLNNLQTDWFNPILIPTGGNFYDINGNFRDILMDVTNFSSQYIYKLSYKTPDEQMGSNEIKLTIQYEGLGTHKTFVYSNSGKTDANKTLTFFPNPFNPEITFLIEHQE